jgi:hypothetical protein
LARSPARPTAATEPSTTSARTLLGLVDTERAPVEGLAVHASDGCLRCFVRRHGYKNQREWPRVKRILQEIGERTEVTLVVFEQFVRAKASE